MGYQQIQARLARPEVLRFFEARAAEFLKTEVKIGSLLYLPPARLLLRKIQVGPSAPSPGFSVVRVDKLVVGYGLMNLIKRDFNLPGRVILKHPRFDFAPGSGRSPVSEAAFSLAKAIPMAFTVENGEFHIPLREGRKELVLEKVRFEAKPDLTGQISLRLAAQISGVATGEIEIEGASDPQFRHYRLEVRLKDVNFLPASGIPLQEVRGEFRMTEKTLEIAGLTSLLHDWKLEWKGTVEDWQALPRIALHFASKKPSSPFKISLHMDFISGRMLGVWSSLGGRYDVVGRVRAREGKIVFPRLKFPHGYTGAGELDPSNGDYHLEIHREKRRFTIDSNANRLNFQTVVKLDHATVNHLDWVVLGRVNLEPLPRLSRQDPLRFKGSIDTDYFIVEYEPLNDFKGTFELDAEGVQRMEFLWGGLFHLSGRVLFKGGKPREDLVIRVDDFPLDTVRDFAGRPVPSNLKGNLEGKLKLRGEAGRPEVAGYFTIKDGMLDKLDFDRAIIQFQGYPPYLKLYDSKIFRGRNTLQLLGAINLTLDNIFHGIQVKGPDSLVLWKGVSAYWKEGQSAIGAEKSLNKKVAMGVEVGAGANPSGEESEESHAVFGPKVRF